MDNMFVELFCPEFNFQVALGFVASLWIVMLTRVTSGQEPETFYIPALSHLGNCDWSIQSVPTNTDVLPVTVTMKHKYNETLVSSESFSLTPESLYRRVWNITKDTKLEAESSTYFQFSTPKGDPLFLLSSTETGKEYILLRDEYIATKDIDIRIYGFHENSTVNFYTYSMPKENSSSQYDVQEVYSMQIGAFENIPLNSSLRKTGVYVNSSQPIGVIAQYSSGVHECKSSDNTWTKLPPISKHGKEFFILVPTNNVFICEILGTVKENLTILTPTGEFVEQLEAYESLSLNITGEKYAQISSFYPIQMMCSTWIEADDTHAYKNQFFLSPMELWVTCSYIVIENCRNRICAVVVSQNHTKESMLISSCKGNISIPAKIVNIGNKTFSVWEIYNQTDGLYRVTVQPDIPITVFKLDLTEGRFFPMDPPHSSLCTNVSEFVSNSINQGAFSESMLTLNESVSSPVSPNAAENSSSTTEQTIINIKQLSVGSRNARIGQSDNITASQSNTNLSSAMNDSKSVTSTTQSAYHVIRDTKYRFMYEEIPDDDKILNEYMIAVIVSLCTAIFGVIAVFSTFLLMEIMSRRRQLGNSKIRPMVS